MAHEDFQRFSPYLNDIALVRLSSPARLNSNVAPVCLPVGTRDADFPDGTVGEPGDSRRALVIGWGKTMFNRDGSIRVSPIKVALNYNCSVLINGKSIPNKT